MLKNTYNYTLCTYLYIKQDKFSDKLITNIFQIFNKSMVNTIWFSKNKNSHRFTECEEPKILYLYRKYECFWFFDAYKL